MREKMMKELREVLKAYEKEGNLERDMRDILFEIRFSKALEILEELKEIDDCLFAKRENDEIVIGQRYGTFERYWCKIYLFDKEYSKSRFALDNYCHKEFFETAEEAAKYLIEKIKEELEEL